MAIHSNILAWRIPWTKKTGGLSVKFILYIYLDILFLKSCVFDNSLKLVTYWNLRSMSSSHHSKDKNVSEKCIATAAANQFSRVWLSETPSLGFSRQEHWSGLPFPSPMHKSEKWTWSRSVMSDSSRPHGLQPTRLLHPWDFPGKSTGVGCHCLLQRNALAHLNSECWQSVLWYSCCVMIA